MVWRAISQEGVQRWRQRPLNRGRYWQQRFTSELSLNLLFFALASTAEGIVRAPADVLVTRAQVGRGRSFVQEDGDAEALGVAIREGFSKVPILLAADLPYVLSRTVVVAALRELLASDSTSLQPLVTMATRLAAAQRAGAVSAAVLTSLVTTPPTETVCCLSAPTKLRASPEVSSC